MCAWKKKKKEKIDAACALEKKRGARSRFPRGIRSIIEDAGFTRALSRERLPTLVRENRF